MNFFLTLWISSLYFIVSCSLPCDGVEKSLHPILDSSQDTIPKKFRTMKDELSDPSYTIVDGLRDLPVSGSGQFFDVGLLYGLSVIGDVAPEFTIVIVDLREESHGLVNGIPISWTNGETNDANLGKSVEQIELDEWERLEKIKKQGVLIVSLKDNEGTKKIIINSALTERQFVESLGLSYLRMPITDHIRPTDEYVDQFIKFMTSLPKKTWLHFHCKGGSGRTTTILALNDMMHNASKISFDDCCERQNLLGGKDLRDLDEESFKYEVSKERLAFIKEFYEYCREVPDFHITWSEWKQERNVKQ